MSQIRIQEQLADGDAGIMRTAQVMQFAAREAIASSQSARELAARIEATVPARDAMSRLQAIYTYLVRVFRFKRDPEDVELLQGPSDTAAQILANGHAEGDCDCLAMLGATLVALMGFNAVILVVSNKPDGRFHHVLFGARLGQALIPLDPQERFFNRLPRLTRQLTVEV